MSFSHTDVFVAAVIASL